VGPAVRRGVFKSVKDLNAKLRTFIDGWSDRSHPFIWTKTAEEVVARANRKKTSEANHLQLVRWLRRMCRA
jgi:hypothetical protein